MYEYDSTFWATISYALWYLSVIGGAFIIKHAANDITIRFRHKDKNGRITIKKKAVKIMALIIYAIIVGFITATGPIEG